MMFGQKRRDAIAKQAAERQARGELAWPKVSEEGPGDFIFIGGDGLALKHFVILAHPNLILSTNNRIEENAKRAKELGFWSARSLVANTFKFCISGVALYFSSGSAGLAFDHLTASPTNPATVKSASELAQDHCLKQSYKTANEGVRAVVQGKLPEYTAGPSVKAAFEICVPQETHQIVERMVGDGLKSGGASVVLTLIFAGIGLYVLNKVGTREARRQDYLEAVKIGQRDLILAKNSGGENQSPSPE